MLTQVLDRHQVLMDGDPLLRRRSSEIVDFDTEALTRLLADMLEIVTARRAWGLAAVQIGVPLRLILAKDVDGDGQYRIFINPRVIRSLNRLAVDREGCLSVETKNWRPVARPAKCEIEWQDGFGKYHTENFSGKLARIIQHEIDHLEGVLITDKPPA